MRFFFFRDIIRDNFWLQANNFRLSPPTQITNHFLGGKIFPRVLNYTFILQSTFNSRTQTLDSLQIKLIFLMSKSINLLFFIAILVFNLMYQNYQ